VAQDAVWISGLVSSYAAAQVVLARLSRINLATPSVWRQTQVWGAKFGTVLEAERQRANALPEQWTPPSRAEQTDQRMGVAFDGVMMNIREEGWKELKVGVVFDVAVCPTVDRRTKEVVDLAHAVHNSYVAHLGGPEVVGEQLWTEARRRGWEQAQDTEGIGDGAAWIWNQMALHFGASHQLVDWLGDGGECRQAVQSPTGWSEHALESHGSQISAASTVCNPEKPLRRNLGQGAKLAPSLKSTLFISRICQTAAAGL
jgi:hypothetical protein